MHMTVKKRLALALAIGIAGVGIGLPAASASTAAPVTQVIKVKTVQDSKTFIQNKNSYTFIAALWQGSKQVGQVTVTCFFASQNAPTSNCGVDVYFYGTGFIFGRVTSTNGAGAAGSLNGGTGPFANAHGTLTVVPITTGSSWATLRFTTAH
jgi:hypothetical protein